MQWTCWFVTEFPLLVVVFSIICVTVVLPVGGSTPLVEHNGALLFVTLVFYAVPFLLSMFVIATIFNNGEFISV